MILHVDRQSHIPLYAQVIEQIRAMITDGALKIGDRLPANRELAKTLGVHRTTVVTAYAELLADGLISSHVGRGTFVCAVPPPALARPAKAPANPSPMLWSHLLREQKLDNWLNGMARSAYGKGTISLAYSLPPATLFPVDDFRRSVDHALRSEGQRLMDSGAAAGYRPLQEYIAAQMSLAGSMIGPEQILITNGCQQALSLIRDVLIGPGDEVAVESPTYPGALSVFCRSGCSPISIPVGPSGMDLNILEDVLSQRRPKLIYTIPSFQNPTGVTMGLTARRRLLELGARHRIPIVEDDIYAEMRYDGPALPSLKALDQQGVVIYINSFSKIGFPGIRVGWVAAEEAIIGQLTEAKRRNDLHTSLLTQAAIYDYSRRGRLARHVKRIKKIYVERRDAMLDALASHFPDASTGTAWTNPAGGMAIWVNLPPVLNSNRVLEEAIEKGVVFSPSQHFYANLAPTDGMRLSFTAAEPRAIEEAVRRLGSILRSQLASVKKNRVDRDSEAMTALV